MNKKLRAKYVPVMASRFYTRRITTSETLKSKQDVKVVRRQMRQSYVLFLH